MRRCRGRIVRLPSQINAIDQRMSFAFDQSPKRLIYLLGIGDVLQCRLTFTRGNTLLTGHSRMREFILGATRGILSSMTVPVFMSH